MRILRRLFAMFTSARGTRTRGRRRTRSRGGMLRRLVSMFRGGRRRPHRI